MLNPNYDRLDYGTILAPPAGYALDFAVGTTYSLDLDALVGASLALGLAEETDSTIMSNPICLLEALRSTGDKVALFCEGGQIHLPGKVTSLYILLEKMVFSVKTAKRRGIAAYPSFHPKFWLIRYKNQEGNLTYRVVVLSRNLTFDRSWDISYYMDGTVTRKATRKNEPICDFLGYLVNQLPSDENGKNKKSSIRKLIKELSNVAFMPPEKEFFDFEFIPNGIKRATGNMYCFDETELFTDTFHELVVISPFLSGDIIRNFNDRNEMSPIKDSRYMLLTREMSLSKLKPEDVSNFEIYTLKDRVIDGETALSDDSSPKQKQDIHAKAYLVKKNTTTNLYLGSLNASSNSVYGNVEFMIKLTAKNRYLNMDKLKEALFCGEVDNPDNPFQQISLDTAIISGEIDKTNNLNAVIKEINRSNSRAIVTKGDDGFFSIRLSFSDCDIHDFSVSVRPLLSQKTEKYKNDMYFEKLTIEQLSEFYVVSVSDGGITVDRVLIIQTDGLPEEREKEVISKVVSDKECFYRYIAFLLGDDTILSALESSVLGADGDKKQKKRTYHLPALYEKMLQTAACSPDKFKGIEYLIKTLSDDDIVPEDFVALYETFKKVVKLDV